MSLSHNRSTDQSKENSQITQDDRNEGKKSISIKPLVHKRLLEKQADLMLKLNKKFSFSKIIDMSMTDSQILQGLQDPMPEENTNS